MAIGRAGPIAQSVARRIASSDAYFSVSGVASLVPVNTVLPVISGTETQGQVLSVTNGTWTNTPLSYGYQWLRDGVAIGGATSSTYTLGLADVGTQVSCTVTATNGSGSGTATSLATGSIAASGGGTAGQPIGLLLILTKAA